MHSEFRKSLFRVRFLFGTIPMFALLTTGLFPLVALELDRLGLDEQNVGAATSSYYLGAVVGAFAFAPIVSRLGQRVGILVAAAIASCATYGLSISDDAAVWLVLRFAAGFAQGAYYLVMDSWVTSVAHRSARGRVYAIYESTRLAATAFGPVILVFGALESSAPVISIAFLLAVIPACLNPETKIEATKRIELGAMLTLARCFPLPLLVILCGGLSNSSFYALGALYATDLGFGDAMIAIFISIVLIAPAIAGLPVGMLADKSTRMGTACNVATVVVAAASVLAVVGPSDIWTVTIAAFVVGGGMVTMYALGVSRIVDAVGEAQAVRAAAVVLLFYNIGSFLGPIITGAMMRELGPCGLYAAIAGFAIVTAVAARMDMSPNRCCPEGSAR